MRQKQSPEKTLFQAVIIAVCTILVITIACLALSFTVPKGTVSLSGPFAVSAYFWSILPLAMLLLFIAGAIYLRKQPLKRVDKMSFRHQKEIGPVMQNTARSGGTAAATVVSGPVKAIVESQAQLSAIEKLTVSIAQITDQTKQISKSLHGSHDNKNALIREGDMKAVKAAMIGIDTTSDMDDVIRAVDDIAFRSKILALNAAVEAARYSIYDKNYALKVEEVKKLAASSASAAREMTALIAGSIQKAQGGADIADDTEIAPL